MCGKSIIKEQHESLTPQVKAAIIAPLKESIAQEKRQIGRLIASQLILVSVIAGMCHGLGATPQFSMAVLIGGGVSILNSLILAWRMARSTGRTTHDAQLQLRLMFFFAAERFLLVMLLLGLVMAVIKYPLAALGGFVSGQAVMILARLYLQFRFR